MEWQGISQAQIALCSGGKGWRVETQRRLLHCIEEVPLDGTVSDVIGRLLVLTSSRKWSNATVVVEGGSLRLVCDVWESDREMQERHNQAVASARLPVDMVTTSLELDCAEYAYYKLLKDKYEGKR